MTSNLLSSSSSLLAREIIFSGLAALGGLIVLCGLWMEWKSEKEWYSDINDFRKEKHKSKHGEKLVMAGIIVEVFVAVLFASLDVWDKHEINKNESNIESKMAPRWFSDDQISVFEKHLQGVPRENFSIFFKENDMESFWYALDLIKGFSKMGFILNNLAPLTPNNNVLSDPFPRAGVSFVFPSALLFVMSTNGSVTSHLPALEIGIMQSTRETGIGYNFENSHNVETNTFVIIVGDKIEK